MIKIENIRKNCLNMLKVIVKKEHIIKLICNEGISYLEAQTNSSKLRYKLSSSCNIEGKWALPVTILDYLKKVKTANLELKENNLIFKAPTFETTITSYDNNLFPEFKMSENYIYEFKTDARFLKNIYEKVFYINQDMLNYSPIGFIVKDNIFYAVGTDGYRLSLLPLLNNIKVNDFKKSLTHTCSKIIKDLIKNNSKEITIAFTEDGITIKDEFITLNHIEKKPLPDIFAVIPNIFTNKVVVNKNKLLSILNEYKNFKNTNGAYIAFNFKENTNDVDYRIKIIKSEETTFNGVFEVEKHEGSDITVALDIFYLINALSSFNSDTVTIEIRDELSPLKFYSDSDKLIHLLCPVRL